MTRLEFNLHAGDSWRSFWLSFYFASAVALIGLGGGESGPMDYFTTYWSFLATLLFVLTSRVRVGSEKLRPVGASRMAAYCLASFLAGAYCVAYLWYTPWVFGVRLALLLAGTVLFGSFMQRRYDDVMASLRKPAYLG
jgi:hypothetical protein